jgi:hypothetical protein
MSNFDCLPGRAGGSPFVIEVAQPGSLLIKDVVALAWIDGKQGVLLGS